MPALSSIQQVAVCAVGALLHGAAVAEARLGGPANASNTSGEVLKAALNSIFVGDLAKAPGINTSVTTFIAASHSGLSAEVAKVEASFLENAFARGSAGRRVEYWENKLNASLHAFAMTDLASMYGQEYLATTTQYANTCCASCGSLDTAALVKGTDYHAVASAQAMQNTFGGKGDYWCGKAGASCGHSSGTAPMGCANCAKGRFIKKLPYSAPMSGDEQLFQKEFHVVVADVCPHEGNEAWCPQAEGQTNTFGSKNHFDWASPPAGFDNYYFAFTPAPCSAEITQRLQKMSQCNR